MYQEHTNEDLCHFSRNVKYAQDQLQGLVFTTNKNVPNIHSPKHSQKS